MRMLSMLLGIACLVLALVIAISDLARAGVPWQRLGQFWFTWSPTSLQHAESFVSRYLDPCGAIVSLGCAPFLWHPLISSVLTWYAAPSFLGLGVLLLFLGRRREPAAPR